MTLCDAVWSLCRDRKGAVEQTWTPEKPTTITWLQNEEGRRMFPILKRDTQAAVAVFCGRTVV